VNPTAGAGGGTRGARTAPQGAWRERRGLTAVDLAVRARLSETTVRRLERGPGGRPKPATAAALAAALGVPLGAVAELRDAG
jgi:transcriptional regulator with XRE-family HTH domain